MLNIQNSSNLDKVLTILEVISDHPTGISLADISKETRIAKTTVFRILETLRNREYVSLDNLTERYLLDIKTLELGIKGLMNVNLVEVSIPYLKKLSNKVNETCFLGVYNHGYVVYLYKSEGNLAIQTNAHLGSRMPAYCTGIGKALLAFQSPEEIERVLHTPLSKVTENTITDKTALHEMFSGIKQRGYSIDNEENEEGLTCFGKPVFNYTNKVVGAISVAGPTNRMNKKQTDIIQELSDVCNIISRRLGFIGIKE